MKHFERVYWAAAKSHGIIAASEAAELGVTPSELNRFCKDGRLERRWRGVYLLTHYVPTPATRYAEAVALVGKGAYLYGSAVLGLHGLLHVAPSTLQVATSARIRRSLPEWVLISKTPPTGACVEYDGIPCQPVADAIVACASELTADEVRVAVDEARRRRLVSDAQRGAILQGLGICTSEIRTEEGDSDVEVSV